MKKNTGISKEAKIAEKAFQEAVSEALDKHARLGVPSVFIKNKKLCYRMPDGSITYETPELFKSSKFKK
ncbi:hypothetical protein ACFLZV_04620 [Candidatus Margulisiibacteriota bacterium]